jgi:DNA primase
MANSTRPYLDFKDIKARADFLSVLDRYRVQVRRVNASQFKADCPLPSHGNKQEHGTFGVNTEKGVFKCFSDSCRKAGNGSQGNVIDFVKLMDGSTPYDAAAKLNDWFPVYNGATTSKTGTPQKSSTNGDGKEATVEPHDGMMTRELFTKIVNDAEPNRPLAFTLKDVNPEHPMIQSRGISVETAKLYGVGFFPGKGSMANRIVFPLYEVLRNNIDGTSQTALVGYAGRTTLEVAPENPKWKLPAGLRKSFVYGLDKCDAHKPLIITESLWAPLWFREKGMQAAALMGTEMTAEQEACLAPFKIVWVCFDNDGAGQEKSRLIVERLKAAGHTVFKANLRE